MPQADAQWISHIPNSIRATHRASAPTNHQMLMPSQWYIPSATQAGMLHSAFRIKLISRHSRNPPLLLIRRITPRDLQLSDPGFPPEGTDPKGTIYHRHASAARFPGDCPHRRFSGTAFYIRDSHLNKDSIRFPM